MSQQRSRFPLETQILQALAHRRRLQHAHVRLKNTFRRSVPVFATARRSLKHSAESSGPLGGDDQSSKRQRGTENALFVFFYCPSSSLRLTISKREQLDSIELKFKRKDKKQEADYKIF